MTKEEKTAEFQIFDRLMKRALRLSKSVVIDFINSLYGKSYSKDCELIYLNSEYPFGKGKRYADSMIQINGTDKYHIEIQMTDDHTMVFRMFEYEYLQASESAEKNEDVYELRFAEPKVIYLQHTSKTPDELQLKVVFKGQGVFDYRVKTFKALTYTPEELAAQKMYILIPFQLLAARDIRDKNLSQEREQRLLHEYDKRLASMVKVLDNGYRSGTIPREDYRELYVMLKDIREYLYCDVEKVKNREVNQMVEEKEMLWSERIRAEGEAEGKADAIATIKKLLASGVTIEEALASVENQNVDTQVQRKHKRPVR